ncbi:MAG: CehA/McbA family metallohydrolase [Anaerolineaceae bacterium]
MNEIVASLHNHTLYSDGSASHAHLINEALAAGIDVLITTDHNVLVREADRYASLGGRHLFMLTAEEVHDQDRQPQKNHMLVIGAKKELAQYAFSPQVLIDQAREADAFTFLAHPNESDLPMFHEPDISWVDWGISGFTGLEIWNHFSEFKDAARDLWRTLYYAFFPEEYAREPRPQTLAKWDELLAAGHRVVAVGGADSHAIQFRRSILHKVIFPYRFHFSCVNTHLLLEEDLTYDCDHDRRLILQALGSGSAFVGYDLPANTRGFRFTAETDQTRVSMGQKITIEHGATIRIRLPQPAKTRLIHNGKVVEQWEGTTQMAATANKSGAYRVECRIDFHGIERGWIYSNPIYVEKVEKNRGHLQ